MLALLISEYCIVETCNSLLSIAESCASVRSTIESCENNLEHLEMVNEDVEKEIEESILQMARRPMSSSDGGG